MPQTLQQRMKSYEAAYSSAVVLPKLPVIVKLDLRSFSKVSKNAEKPFDKSVATILGQTLFRTVQQVEGAVFGFQYSDKIIIVIKNDQSIDTEPWFGNNIQKISSTISSIATYEFLNFFWQMENPPNLDGAITFSAMTFGVPSSTECINYLINTQFKCINNSVNEAAVHTLQPIYGPDTAQHLESRNINERQIIISDNSEGTKMEDYPTAFRYGIAAYVVPYLSESKNIKNGIDSITTQIPKQKWILNFNIPDFSKDRSFITNIIKTGSDIFRIQNQPK